MTISEKQLEANRRNAPKSMGPKTAEGKAITRVNALRHGMLSRLEVLPYVERSEDWESHLALTLADLQPQGYLEETLTERIALLLWRLGRVARYEREAAAIELENTEGILSGTSLDELFRENYLVPSPLQAAVERIQVARVKVQTAREKLDFLGYLSDMTDTKKVDADLAAWLMELAATTGGVNIYDEDLVLPDYPNGVALKDVDWDAGHLRRCVDAIANHAGQERLLDQVSNVARRGLEKVQGELKALERELDQRRRRSILPQTDELVKVSRYETHLERAFYKALHELQRLQAARNDGNVPLPVPIDVTVTGGGKEAM